MVWAIVYCTAQVNKLTFARQSHHTYAFVKVALVLKFKAASTSLMSMAYKYELLQGKSGDQKKKVPLRGMGPKVMKLYLSGLSSVGPDACSLRAV